LDGSVFGLDGSVFGLDGSVFGVGLIGDVFFVVGDADSDDMSATFGGDIVGDVSGTGATGATAGAFFCLNRLFCLYFPIG